jgi:Ser/Thr protein kinase RdoA (MazF antagonist)
MNAAIAQLDNQKTVFLHGFGFEEIEVTRRLDGGMFSRPVLLEADGRRYLLRTHSFRSTVEAFRFQAETLKWAAEHGVPCARVMPFPDGSWCRHLVDGRGVLALHEFVEGSCDDWEQWHIRKESQPGFLGDLGRQVAHLHNVLRQTPILGDPALSVELPPIHFHHLDAVRRQWDRDLDRLQSARWTSPAIEQLMTLRRRIAEHLQRLADAIEPRVRHLPRQIVHGDISPVNLVRGAASHWSFIDWDCVHVGWRLYDALGDVLHRPPCGRHDLNLFRMEDVADYLAGYEAEINEPITVAERELILPFCLARQFEDLRQRVRSLQELAAHQHADYATLISQRVEMMDQISFK